jgi:DNA-binding IclR family transcriptional regulator
MTDSKAHGERKYIVPAVEQAIRVLFRMASSQSSHMSLTEIYSGVGIPKSKAYSILITLKHFGLVQRNADGAGYSLGPGLIGLSRRFLDNLSAPKLAEPILEDISRKSGTTATFGLIADKNVFVAAKHEGRRPIVVTMRVGHRLPVTWGCHGKAIAAFLPEEELNDLLKDGNVYFQGEPMRFDKARLMADLKGCRERWFALDLEETVQGLNAVAAPVLGPNGYPVGYIALLGLPSAEAAEECGSFVAEAGKELSRQLGADLDRTR